VELLSDYDYDLPEALIAQHPLEVRSASRMLWLHRKTGQVEHRQFTDLVSILQPGDLLVMNDTRVTARRLFGEKQSGGQVEALLLEPRGEGRYVALVKPAKRLKPGTKVSFGPDLHAEVTADLGEGKRELSFESGADPRIAQAGEVPLPPYITEKLQDPERYQTVLASAPGSAAAPTAALHFTKELLGQIRERGVGIETVTLNVGIDTFRPVQTEKLDEHRMHGETCTLPEKTAKAVETCQGRVVAVGTTSVRTLESFATGPRKLEAGTKRTELFIREGYRFQVVDGMLTNFHMPRTTMMVMISAFAGRQAIRSAYDEAINQRYRFLSFGDSMLII